MSEAKTRGDEKVVLSADDIEARPAPTTEELASVRDLAAALWKARKRLADLVKEGDEISEEIEMLEEKSIPDAMRKVGFASFSLSGGFRVELEPFAHGSVKKEDEPAFFRWLDAAKMGGIIKNTFTISLGRDNEKLAKKLARDLAKRKVPVPFEIKEAIHASTWKAFVRERLEAEARGEVPEKLRLPRDLVAAHEGVKAVIVDPAEEAAKAAKKRAGKKSKEKVEM